MPMRLAYTLSAGTTQLLASTTLALAEGKLRLTLSANGGAFVGEGVTRRLERLALAVGVEAEIVDA